MPTKESPDAEQTDEQYVCHPCRTMNAQHAGEIVVPGGTKGTVWCPWCGDAMERAHDETGEYRLCGQVGLGTPTVMTEWVDAEELAPEELNSLVDWKYPRVEWRDEQEGQSSHEMD